MANSRGGPTGGSALTPDEVGPILQQHMSNATWDTFLGIVAAVKNGDRLPTGCTLYGEGSEFTIPQKVADAVGTNSRY